jgi:hypothetical protein
VLSGEQRPRDVAREYQVALRPENSELSARTVAPRS